jgi:hypothetical protein
MVSTMIAWTPTTGKTAVVEEGSTVTASSEIEDGGVATVETEDAAIVAVAVVTDEASLPSLQHLQLSPPNP